MSGPVRRLAEWLAAAAARLLPPRLSTWSRAMARELIEIEDDKAALLFAVGSLRAAAGLAVAEWLSSALSESRHLKRRLPVMKILLTRPRLLGLACGAVAVAMGLAYMLAAGAPTRYLLVNLAALVLGATAWLALGRTAASRLAGAGPAILALSVPLLLTALFGAAADGASRWVIVGPLSLQVSLIMLPAMIILYARRPDAAGTLGLIAAALALAIQPDRAMAGVLAASLFALLLAKPGRSQAVAAAAAVPAFGWTLLAPDLLPASAFVDQILYTAFDVHPLAGAAVLVGAATLVVPAAAGLAKGGGERAALLAFGGCWATMVAAAALGNYPTPLVGYGGSAVLGYLLSVSLLPAGPRRAEARAPARSSAAGRERRSMDGELRTAYPV